LRVFIPIPSSDRRNRSAYIAAYLAIKIQQSSNFNSWFD
jgi:hypothetical protein